MNVPFASVHPAAITHRNNVFLVVFWLRTGNSTRTCSFDQRFKEIHSLLVQSTGIHSLRKGEKSMTTPRAKVRSPIILQTNRNNCSGPLHIYDLANSSPRMHLDTNSVCVGSSTGGSLDAFLKHKEYHFFENVVFMQSIYAHILLGFPFCPWAAVVGFVVPTFHAICRRFG